MNIAKQDTMKLKITINDKIATAILYDNPTSRDFVSMFPLTVQLDDYANTEKVFTPSKKLTTKDAPKGFDPSVGDLTYYAPWGNIALFYKDFGYANGLISLGKIIDGIEHFKVNGSVTVKIELEN
ncbi:cyclophilin-like fold protein [Tenacibaculum sp. IB213877]|uniref:cyclophilin-like fold protein n=1 Tax=Tenacibaculum sp. IB213877 TaxID=3097351 RepID=UPI002A5A1503|nr:cyclophilin-like fold protein [Tenacibaculum sp. IB213877]MDY0780459.1 cyclophilin-like fold protein [Tenacibaculum sp. IB213877]